MKKEIAILGGIAAFVLLLGLVWFNMRAAPAIEARLNSLVQVTKKEQSEKNPAQAYAVQLAYPQITGLPSSNAAVELRINKMMEEVALRRAEDFKKNSIGFGGAGAQVGPLPGGNTLELDYEIQLPKNRLGNLLSVLFYETTYYQGAAHPGHTYFSYIFDLASGREVKLADLFAADDLYTLLSQRALQSLRASFVRQDVDEGGWFPEGAAPKEENFQVYTLSDNGLELYFNEYQVAPYAAGPQRVVLPFDTLDSLRPRLWK